MHAFSYEEILNDRGFLGESAAPCHWPLLHTDPEPSESSTFRDSHVVDAILFRDVTVAPRVKQAVEIQADVSDPLRRYPKGHGSA